MRSSARLSATVFWLGLHCLMRSLVLLHLFLLGGMGLLEMLCLLGVFLFHRRFLRFAVVLLRGLLVLFLLLILELLVILCLFGSQLVLLLLIFLVGFGIAGVGRSARMRL